MLNNDPIARDLIAAALGKAADSAVREHLQGLTQEAPLTARLGQILESTMNGQIILGHRLTVVTQDIPDRGPGALEKQLGADLYFGIEVIRDGHRESKGLFIQSKLKRNLKTKAQREDLEKACKQMLDRNESSYVWLYGSNGIRVLEARSIVENQTVLPLDMPARRASTLFSRTLECTEGAVNLGLPEVKSARGRLRSALADMLDELRVPQGVAVSVQQEG